MGLDPIKVGKCPGSSHIDMCVYFYTFLFSSSLEYSMPKQATFFFQRAGVHTLTKIRPKVVTSNPASGACFQDSSLQFAGMILSMHYLWENSDALAVA